jgi:desulfoferrodoxin (superoxide reductase-like protein)
MKTQIVSIASSLIIITALFSACSDTGKGSESHEKLKSQIYFSAEEPGRWEPQAADHDLRVAIIEDAKGKKGIEVFVPFTQSASEQHYVEAIALVDEKGRQLDIVRFNRGEKAITIFPVTDRIIFPVYAVARCNMHDMWRKKVTGEEKAGEE